MNIIELLTILQALSIPEPVPKCKNGKLRLPIFMPVWFPGFNSVVGFFTANVSSPLVMGLRQGCFVKRTQLMSLFHEAVLLKYLTRGNETLAVKKASTQFQRKNQAYRLLLLSKYFCIKATIQLRKDSIEDNKLNFLNGDICGSSLGDRIIGGVNASLGQYPWIAGLGYAFPDNLLAEPTFRCGAALINNCFVVTAGHCVSHGRNEMVVSVVRLGEHNMMTDVDCDADECADRAVDVKPKKIYLHPNYSQRTFKNDIALIKLEETVKYTKWIRPICLPYGDLLSKDFIGSTGDVAGWGIADLSENIGSDILQTVKLPILGIKNCQKHYKKVAISEDSNLCAGGVLGKDSCGGDSGGPLMKVEVFNGPPRYFLIGVVSFGSKLCAQSTVPAVYTRISYYMPWILENLSKC